MKKYKFAHLLPEVKQLLEAQGHPRNYTEIAHKLIKKHRLDYTNERAIRRMASENDDENPLTRFIEERGIDRDEIKKVKHWQNFQGDPRFSVDTYNINEVNYNELFESLVEQMKSYAPKYPKLSRDKKKGEHILVLDPADIHIGKLVSRYETGGEYNVNIAIDRVNKGVEGILQKASGFKLDQINLVIGNDVLHIDNAKRTTTSGTPQDTDGMWFDCFIAAKDMYVNIIERLVQICDVHVTYNPSNHDYMSGWFLAQTIEAWFRNSKNITFDTSIAHRKYFTYGENLIATSHGDGAKMDDMPMLMANEAKQAWANTKFHYVYLHHVHHKIRKHFASGKDYHGVTVEYLRTPSSSDSWHHRNGYDHAPKAIEGFIHHKNEGQVARFTHYF